ncbi:hypothetical protein B0H17DRAFT_306492 [Mycena rosella]|uniref:Tetratricopeptide repeat protein n=1 Tax=Mycena rosella TaxID=1033263 RepID=A0AAD7DTD9_MYCRO|nr:hypothetical protein B0H17DRAFT_306492 [Mycena rosella]
MAKILRHLGEAPRDLRDRDLFCDEILEQSCSELWLAGLLDEALTACDQIINYFRNAEVVNCVDEVHCQRVQMRRIFILCDMRRIPEVVEILTDSHSRITAADDVDFLLPWLMQTRILPRTGRNREALQILRGVLSEVSRRKKHSQWANDEHVFDLHFHLLLAELAAAWGRVGRLENAVRIAERAVATCRSERDDGEDVEQQKHVLVHTLTTLSNCLAAAGRSEEALAAAKDATLIYAVNEPQLWAGLLFTMRREELGGNAFHSLSLRFLTAGKLDDALLNAEKATDLYRKLVSLAPRHLPTLAASLQNLAAISCRLGRIDKSVSISEEAVGIMRQVSKTETYFLLGQVEALDQLACYLSEKGEADGTTTATTECAEAREKITLLPPQADFLFSEMESKSQVEPEDILKNTVFLARTERGLEVPIYLPVPSGGFSQELSSKAQSEADLAVTKSEISIPPAEKTPRAPAANPIPTPGGENVPTENGITGKYSVVAALASAKEVKGKKSMSTPMGIIWWIILLGILSMASAALCTRK